MNDQYSESAVHLSVPSPGIITFLVSSTAQIAMAAAFSASSAFDGSSVNSSLDNISSTTASFFDNFTEYPSYDYPPDTFEPCRYGRHAATFLPILYSIFFIVGLVGNSLVIWVIVCGVRLRSMTDVCLLNLAVADLLLVCSLPFLAHQARDQWQFGELMCKGVLSIYYIAFYCGIFFISLMSIDRYLAIVHAVYAMRARTRSFGMIAAGVTWLAGVLASFPELIYLKLQHDVHNMTYCYPDFPTSSSDESSTDTYHFWRVFSLLKMNILGLLIPFIMMVFCYSQIIWRLLNSRSSKKPAIRLVVIVVAVFFCCWVPYNITALFRALEYLHIYAGCESSQAILIALQATEAVAYSHSCLNPFLYVFVGEKFRRHLLKLVNRTPCRLCQAIKVYLPQDRSGSAYSQTTSLDERSTAV
ncbi:C-C chemokine receptor type 5 isoform X2 [Cheilinus undulatus]|uniref:C-C chemokine receptor type 5 isoform X2 n=1 Tax=Cheilinus undulatus TaxID=241271 RepID=UPI001BD4790A|nr:C-C chemokine receptor type 5 isoform X2 [Cheilinus undulatus]